MQDDGKTVFLVSKPLQIMIALMVMRQLRVEQPPVFAVVNAFKSASEVAERLGQVYGDRLTTRFFETPRDAFLHIRREGYRHLFIHGDVGLRNALTLAMTKLRVPKIRIYVFEEGLGTYTDDIYPRRKARAFRALGIATRFGESPFVRFVFLLDPASYRAKFPKLAQKVVAISGSLSDFLAQERTKMDALFGFSGLAKPENSNGGLCNLYLSNWKVDNAFLQAFKALPGDLFIKLHPHFQTDLSFEGMTMIDTHVPAEIAIADLLEEYDTVKIFDHMSSVRQYVDSQKITFQCVDTFHC